jgi:hypothetical protein
MRSPKTPSQPRPRSRKFTAKRKKDFARDLALSNAEEDLEPLSPAQIRELRRRVRDSRDPIRYMLVSEFNRRFILYYNVSDDVYAMNNPSGGTLFKRLKTAQTVKKLLGGGTSIVKYTTARGKLKRLSPYRPRI